MYKKYRFSACIFIFLLTSCDNKNQIADKKDFPDAHPIQTQKTTVNQNNSGSSLEDLKRDIANNSKINYNNNNSTSGFYVNELINNNPLATLNSVRNKIGLNPVSLNQNLNIAAQKHAFYLLSNDIASHEESPGLKNFYGQWPIDRAQNAGYTSGYEGKSLEFNIGEVLTLSPEDPSKGLDSLMRAIYHRFIMLEPAYNEIGLSSQTIGSKSTLSMLFGVKTPHGQLSPLKLSYYPYNNSYVPTSFRPEEEIPNPVPEKEIVGYPVSVQLPIGYPLEIENFSMINANTGSVIQGKTLLASKDAHVKENQFAFIPWEPLSENTTYNITVKGKTTGATINFAWSFTTLTKEPFEAVSEKSVYQAGDLLKINYKMSDGYKLDTNIRSRGTSKLLLERIDNQPWGTLLYKVLPGCQISTGCETTFTFTNDLSQSTQLKVIITN